jgi:CubicO group peptidase (beta-lactamase class C family)
MKRSNFTVAAMHAEPNHSEAYELNTKREVVKVEHEPLDMMGPTGSINSSVDEMARYTRMMLAGGLFEGKRVLLEADVQAMMQPNTPGGKAFSATCSVSKATGWVCLCRPIAASRSRTTAAI